MFVFDYLKNTQKPIVLYGTGNGGDKLLELCEEAGICVSGVFSSDDHQSGAVFHGMPVTTLSEITSRFPNPVILLAFGTERSEIIDKIKEISERYEVLAPDLPLFGGAQITPEYVENNAEEMNGARSLFADKRSQRVFDCLTEYKITGRLSPLFEAQDDASEKRGLLSLSENEDYLDLGAYNGDTVDEFLSLTGGKYRSITAFEPNPRNFRKLTEHVNDLHDTECLEFASWSGETELVFTGKSGRSCSIVTDVAGRKPYQYTVRAIAADSLKRDFSFVKMDVEGAEEETLIGMREMLNRCHPSMQVSVYHRTEDYFKIPLLIERLCPGYKMYLRHHPSIPAWELQLYCVWNKEI